MEIIPTGKLIKNTQCHLIKEIGKSRTVILSTHNLAEVQVACDRVLIIARGKIVADDKPHELMERAGRGRFLVSVQRIPSFDEAQRAAWVSALGQLPGAARAKAIGVSGEDDAWAFEVIPTANADLRADIFQLAVQKGVILLELRREGQNLEQIFRDLTLGAGASEIKHAA